MSFFMDSAVSLSSKLLECVYIFIGLIAIYAGVKNLLDKENPARYGTFVFWTSFGLICALGHWLPARTSGVLVIIMILPAIFRRVKVGKQTPPTKEYTRKQYKHIGMKIFIPALTMGIMSLVFALLTKISALVGVAVGVLISIILLMAYSRDNKPATFLKDSERFLSMMGPLCMLPQLLGALGGVFTAAGVGDVIGKIVSGIVPQGNVTVGIHCICHRHGIIYSHYGQCLWCDHSNDHWHRGALHPKLWRGSGCNRHGRLDLRLLRNTDDAYGC